MCPQCEVFEGTGGLCLSGRMERDVLFLHYHRTPHTNVFPSHSAPASVQVSRSGQQGPVGRGLGLAPSQSTNQTFVECLLGASAEGTQSGANQGPGFQGTWLSCGGMTHEQTEQEVSLGMITEPVEQTSSVRRLGTGGGYPRPGVI